MKVRTDDTFMNKMYADFHRRNQSNVNPLKILEKIREKKGSSPERKKVVNKAFYNNIMNSDFSKYKKTLDGGNVPMSDGELIFRNNAQGVYTNNGNAGNNGLNNNNININEGKDGRVKNNI